MKFTPRQQEIIDKSVIIIAERGIQHLTIKNIAKELNFTEPALYRHFVSKHDILLGILNSFDDVATSVLDNINNNENENRAWVNIELFIMDRFERMSANPPLSKVMFSEEIFQYDEELSDKVLKIMHGHKDLLQKYIELGQRNGEFNDDIDSLVLFRLIMGPVRLLIKQWGLSGFKFDLIEEGKKICDALQKLLLNTNHKLDRG